MTLEEGRALLSDTDARMAQLFERRMDIVRQIARVKEQSGLPVRDEAQEKRKIEAVSALVKDEYRPYAEHLFKEMMASSRAYQEALREKAVKKP